MKIQDVSLVAEKVLSAELAQCVEQNAIDKIVDCGSFTVFTLVDGRALIQGIDGHGALLAA